MFGKKSINIGKQQAGTTFNVRIRYYQDRQVYEGTLEILDSKERKLSFKLKRQGQAQGIDITTTVVDKRLIINRAIASLEPVGILLSFELQEKEET